jgi:hypothetical protein
MAVSSNLTSLEDFEAGPTYNNIGSGGGANDDTNAPIEGVTCGGRRLDNQTDKGFMATITSVDLSAAGEHVKMWLNTFQWNAVTALQARIRSGTNVYDNHVYPAADIPLTMGYIPVWVDVSRTPDSQGSSGSANEAAITDIGFYLTIGNIGGAGNNCLMDEIHHGTSGLVWSGAGGDFGDFRTYEGTNVEGNFVSLYQADLCFSRLQLSDTASTTFTDAGFNIVCPDQALVSSTFMGITADLTHASTDVNLSNGTFASGDPVGATNRPDLLVIGTLNGVFDMDTLLLNGLRTIELNEQCTLTNSTVLNSGVIDATNSGTTNGADLSGTKVIDSIAASDTSAVIWDVNADPDTKMTDMVFERGAATHHAIELGLNSPLTVNFNGLTSTGFNATDAQNDSFFHVLRTTGTVTINVSGSTGNFSYKSAGAIVNVVLDTVTLDVTAVDNDTKAGVQNAYVTAWTQATTPTGPFDPATVTIVQAAGTATVTHTAHGLSTGDEVRIDDASPADYNGLKTITVTTANAYTFPIGSGVASPATGTITASLLLINGLTDANGDISSTARTLSSDQEFTGEVKKGTSSPVYVVGSISGRMGSLTGASATASLVRDE